MNKLIFFFILALSFTHCQVISGCLRYYKNQYNQQKCIQCIYGMGLTSSNTCQFCKPGLAVSGGVCKPIANNNIQQSAQTAQIQQIPVQQPLQPQSQPQSQIQNIINTNDGAQGQQATTSQSYTPLKGNLNSENNAINNNNQNTVSVTNTNLNAINNNASWGDNYSSSFQASPNLNQMPINSQVSSVNQSSSNTLLNIPINQFLSSQNQITNIPNNLPLKNIASTIPQPKTINQIPSVISTKPNLTTVPPATPLPSPISKDSTTMPKPSTQASPSSVQPAPKQVQPIVHKYPQYPFCFDYADGSCWACVPEYVLNLIINQCIPYVKPPNVAFAQKTQKPVTSTPDQNCDVYSKQKGICEECFRNYYFDIEKKQCLAVNLLCRTYNKQNGKCQSCYNKYKLTDGQCVNS